MARPHFSAAAASDRGRERARNEDRVLCEPDQGVFAVIDGVGGAAAGEVAAQTALEVLRARLARKTTDPGRRIREAIALANRRIWEQSRADPRLHGMACVLTVAVVEDGRATVGHVGDSRLYRLRAGGIEKLTRDHSPIGAREERGELTEAEAMAHPRRNEILRDVGSAPHEPDDPEFVDLVEVPFEPEAALLLCSDGLSDLVPAAEIRALVERHAGDPQAAARALVGAANSAGGRDNVSVVVVEGDRFAAAVRRAGKAGRHAPRREAGAAAAGGTAPRVGAGPARPAGSRRRSALAERFAGALAGRASPSLLVLLGAVLGIALAVVVGGRLEGSGGIFGGGRAAGVLQVGTGDGQHRTIGAALDAARPGDTIEVAPGEYRERLRLREGVAVVSRVPRGAVLRPPGGAAAVEADRVRGARLSGFRVAGGGGATLAVGVRLAGAEATIDDVEVTGAAVAAVESLGEDRSTVSYSFLHDNPGAGVMVRGGAAPRLLHNLIAGNGAGPPPRPGVEVRDAARPLLAGNRIVGNGGPEVRLAVAADATEVWLWNAFGTARREAAVVVAVEPGPPSSPEP